VNKKNIFYNCTHAVGISRSNGREYEDRSIRAIELMTEAVRASETSAYFNETTRRDIFQRAVILKSTAVRVCFYSKRSIDFAAQNLSERT
jgi:hypothetical protein